MIQGLSALVTIALQEDAVGKVSCTHIWSPSSVGTHAQGWGPQTDAGPQHLKPHKAPGNRLLLPQCPHLADDDGPGECAASTPPSPSQKYHGLTKTQRSKTGSWKECCHPCLGRLLQNPGLCILLLLDMYGAALTLTAAAVHSTGSLGGCTPATSPALAPNFTAAPCPASAVSAFSPAALVANTGAGARTAVG